MNFNNKRTTLTLVLGLVAAVASGLPINGQFLPQSHLGRLVQSITSPLMIAPSAYREQAEAEAPYPDPSSYYPQAGAPPMGGYQPMSANQQQQQQQIQPEASRHEQHQTGRRLQLLQQSPSRGMPQQYYGPAPPMGPDMSNSNNNNNNNDIGPADQEDRDQGAAPSNNKQRNPNDYQMGAYLGPTIDDKEINGAFNSNNDDRDEDDGPSSYDGASGRDMGGRNKAASSNAYNNDIASYGPASSSSSSGPTDESNYGQQPSSADSGHHRAQPDQVSSYDEDGADEDEPSGVQAGPRSAAGSRQGRAGLSGAASQYQQQGSYGGGDGSGHHQHQLSAGQAQRGPMMAAANGYAPFGYAAGPVDLTNLMAGLGGADPNAGYQVYNGDGSYPGAGYYQQQGQRGGRNQAASMSNYNTNDGYGPGPMQQQRGLYGGQRANQDNDDDSEGDD